MKKIRKFYNLSICMGLLLPLCLFVSCADEWLEIRSDKSIVIPATLRDADALLYANTVMNVGCPNLGEVAADSYVATASQLASSTPWELNTYLWNEAVFVDDAGTNNWNSSYQKIYYANMAIEVADKVERIPSEDPLYRDIVARAKFFRSMAYFQLSQIFCDAYGEDAGDRMGLPLRKVTDVEHVVERASLAETYTFMIEDLQYAAAHLPLLVEHKITPSRPAAYALLARIYLIMDDFERAFLYADSCLQLHSTLIDYNLVSAPSGQPFARFNAEVIFDSSMLTSNFISGSRVNVSQQLLSMYAVNDLRPALFFRNNNGVLNFRGSYYGSSSVHFGGIAVDEVYLIRAEAAVRTGRISVARDDLNFFLKHRLVDHSDIVDTDPGAVLDLILKERRKQLLFRGVRWSDLKRLNRDVDTETTLSRLYDGKTITLTPRSERYVFPIPDVAVDLGGYTQNQR